MSTDAAPPAAAAQRPRAVQFAGSLFFTCFFLSWTFFYAIPFVVACACLPFPKRFPLVQFYARVLLWVLKWSCGLTYRIEGEPLPQGAHVALWKHSSSWETVAMMVVFPRQVWVLKRELTWIPFVGLGVKQMHCIAIDRKAGHSAVSQVVEQGLARIAEGDWVMVFPEGTRMKHGETRRYGVSGSLLAAAANVCVVPVAHNAGHYWPRRGIMKKPGTIRVVIGKPVPAADRDVRELNAEVQEWIETTIRGLS